jgi:hypothetical protein
MHHRIHRFQQLELEQRPGKDETKKIRIQRLHYETRVL